MLRVEDIHDVTQLREAARLLEAENHRLVAKVMELTRELQKAKGADAVALQLKLEELEQQLAAKNHMLFGKSSEKRSPPNAPEPRTKQPGHGPKEQPALPHLEQVHKLDQADQKCTVCGGELAEWEGQFEESEEVNLLARTFVLVKHKRQKYRCKCGGCVDTALAPKKLFEGARYSVDFAIEVAVQKYLDHLPLERQVRIMRREGLDVDSQTLWDYLERLARLLAPAHDALHEYQLLQAVLGADETRWPLMGAKGGEKSTWQVWALASAKAAVYRILDSRSADAAREVLKDYSGVVMADAYSAYEALVKQGGEFTLANCWSHVRRKALEAEPFFPQASELVSLIGELYAIEAACATGPPGDEERRRLRNEKSRAIVSRIQAWALG